MTPREMQHLIVMDKCGHAKVKDVAKKTDTSVTYSRHLLDNLTRSEYVGIIGRDSYQILSKGIDAIIDEYMHTLNRLERRINKHLNHEHNIVAEIERLKSKEKQTYEVIK